MGAGASGQTSRRGLAPGVPRAAFSVSASRRRCMSRAHSGVHWALSEMFGCTSTAASLASCGAGAGGNR